MSRGDQHNPASREEQARRMLQDWYYRSSGPPPAGAGAWTPLPAEIIRVKLTAAPDYDPDDPPDDPQGTVVELDDDNQPQDTDRQVWLRDPMQTGGSVGSTIWAIATHGGTAPESDCFFEPLFGLMLCTGKTTGTVAKSAATFEVNDVQTLTGSAIGDTEDVWTINNATAKWEAKADTYVDFWVTSAADKLGKFAQSCCKQDAPNARGT